MKTSVFMMEKLIIFILNCALYLIKTYIFVPHKQKIYKNYDNRGRNRLLSSFGAGRGR